MKTRSILFLLALLWLALLYYALKANPVKNPEPKSSKEPKVNVIASFYPLAEFAKKIGRGNYMSAAFGDMYPTSFRDTAARNGSRCWGPRFPCSDPYSQR